MTWRLCLLGVVSLASLVAPTGSCTGLSRAVAGSPGALVVVSDRDSPGGLYLVNGDGAGLRRLAWSGGSPASNSTSGFEQPRWSPTGGLIAAIRAHEGVLVVGKTGDLTSIRRVSGPNDFVTSFSWSPDGKRLAYADIGKKTIDVVGTDGRGRMELASSGDRPAWSPDGRQIAFAR